MMKSVSTIVASVVCALLFLPGCDGSQSLKDEYEVRSTELSLSAAGGEQTVSVLNQEGQIFGKDWSLFNVTISDTLSKCGTTKFVDDEALRIDTLADGTCRASGSWYSFAISKDRRQVQVKLSPNQTGHERRVIFKGVSSIDRAFSIYVKQQP
jgi:hypothetical protein